MFVLSRFKTGEPYMHALMFGRVDKVMASQTELMLIPFPSSTKHNGEQMSAVSYHSWDPLVPVSESKKEILDPLRLINY